MTDDHTMIGGWQWSECPQFGHGARAAWAGALLLLGAGGFAPPVNAQYLASPAPAANPVTQVSGTTIVEITAGRSADADNDGDFFYFDPPLRTFGDRIAEKGVYLRGFAQATSYAVASGGRRRGNLLFGETFYGVDFDLQRILGWRDAIVSLSLNSRFGAPSEKVSDYSGSSLGFIQGVGPSSTTRLNELTIDQHFARDRIRIIIGRHTLANYFATSTLYCQFEIGLCSNLVPSIVGGDTNAPFWPIAVWAGEASFWPSKNLYGRIGVSESNPAQYTRGGFPWNKGWSIMTATGAFIPAEVGYVTTPEQKRYYGKVAFGLTVDTSNFPDPRYNDRGQPIATFGGIPRGMGAAATVYGQAERAVWRPDPQGTRGLALLAGFQSDLGGHAPIRTYVVAGAVLSGILTRRPHDTAGLLVQHHRLGDRQIGFLDDVLASRDRVTRLSRSETIVELNYEAQVARGIRVKPYAAFIVDPDQLGATSPDPELKHALLLGVRASIYFNPALGLSQLSRPN